MSAARLAYKVEGPANAPPVVLLHALATSSDLWLPQLPVWAAQFLVIRIDLPGHGASPLPDGVLTLADFAAEVKAVLDDLNIQKAAFVGLSLGGMVAQAFALAFPERCSAIVLAHTSARTDAKVREIWEGRLTQLENEGLPAQADAILGRWFPPAFAASSPLTLKWVAGQITATPPAGYARAIRAIQQLDHLDRLKDITVPVQVIAGELDMAAPVAVGQLMAAKMPLAQLVVMPGVAHIGNVQAPVLFTETAGLFLHAELQA
ncbi:MAG: alpha/beta fold hydrolase [Pseudomonadota bacterium]